MRLNGSARHVPSIKVVSAEFICEPLVIETNVIDAAVGSDVEKFLPLGSSHIYPRLAEQSMPEHTLLKGLPELTKEPYATAKIVGMKLCKSYSRRYNKSLGVGYRRVMPMNLSLLPWRQLLPRRSSCDSKVDPAVF